MPIRINLKELFSADSQSTVIDKVNFNFNKLLELGIGEPGERGFSGIQGAAGPLGLTGEQGIRGATWFVDSAQNPNTLTFQDVLEGDLYLDSNNLAIWQYTGTQWDFVVDITNVINNYLTASPSPFKRGFGIGTPNDDRFILFNKRDDAIDVQLGAAGSTSQNDILFLSNYDEDTIIPFTNGPAQTPTLPQVDTNDFYNSLLAISIDHRSSFLGRHHIEFGSLYDNATPKLTTTYENLKIKYYRDQAALHGLDHINFAQFSLDIPDVFSGISGGAFRTANGIFEFKVPKYNAVDNTSYSIYLGSKYGLDEIAANGADFIKSDGILFSSGSSFGNVGLIEGYSIPNYPLNTGYVSNTAANSYLWLESLDANGTLIDDTILQNGGNIIQLATTAPRLKATVTSPKGAPSGPDFFASGAITILGSEVYTGFGNTNIYNGVNSDLQKFGYFNKFSISDPNNPTSDFIITGIDYIKFDGKISAPSVGAASCNTAYQISENPIGPGLKDLVSDGDYIYAVNSQRVDKNPLPFTSGGSTYEQTSFQILKKNQKNSIGLQRVSRLGQSLFINGANRIKLFGKYVIVANNTLQGWTNLVNISDPFASLYDGRLTAIDVSDPLNPRIESSASVIPAKILTAPSTTAILDLDIVDDYAVAVTWEQTDGTTTSDIRIKFDAFDLRGLKRADPTASGTIEWIGRGNTNIYSANAQSSVNIQALAKTAAISSNGRYVYVGYGQTVYKYSFNPLNGVKFGTSPNCYLQFALEDQITVSSAAGRQIVDIKVLGNSLYVLLSDSSNGQFVKFEVEDSLTQIYSKSLSGQAVSRFENSGKHFYIACQNSSAVDTSTSSLIALDFDGIYTGGAHIESIRTEEMSVIKDLKVGSSINVAGSLNVGSGAQIQGHLGVEKAIQTPYLINDEDNLNISASGTTNNLNLSATSDINLTAADDVNITATDIANITSTTNDVTVNAAGDFITSATNTEINSSNRIDIYCPNGGAPQSQISADLGNIYVYANDEMQLQADGAAPANYNNLSDLPIRIYGHLSASGVHANQITNFSVTQPAIISGTFNPPANNIPNDTFGASYLNWQKIGSIIHVTGVINLPGSNTGGSGLIPLPIWNSGLTISNLGGHATISNGTRSTVLSAFAEYDPGTSTNSFYFSTRLNQIYVNTSNFATGVLADIGDGVSASPSTVEKVRRQCQVYFTMSYRIS